MQEKKGLLPRVLHINLLISLILTCDGNNEIISLNYIGSNVKVSLYAEAGERMRC